MAGCLSCRYRVAGYTLWVVDQVRVGLKTGLATNKARVALVTGSW